MTDQNQTLRDDISFMRGLAEAGRDRPMVGGSIMLVAGLIFGAASLAVWYFAAVSGIEGWMYSAVWGAAFLLYMVFLVPLLRALPRTAGAYQAAAGIAWSGVGWSIFFIVLSMGVMSYRLQTPYMMMALPSVLMALYGASWFVGAILLRQRWLYGVAFGSFALALVNAWFANGDAVWLIYGVGLLVLMAAPGAVLMRQARRAA
jgi:hypothetical protein